MIPEDEMVPDEFRGQEKGKIASRLNPELEELEEGHYRTESRLAKAPAVDVLAEDNSQRYRADSERKAYTEGLPPHVDEVFRDQLLHRPL